MEAFCLAQEHQKELSDFNTTLADQNATQEFLRKAMDSLKGFYQEAPGLVQTLSTPEARESLRFPLFFQCFAMLFNAF